MKIAYYGPHYTGAGEGAFRCMSFGFPNTAVDTDECRFAPYDFEAQAVAGTYEECLDLARKLADAAQAGGNTVKAAIAFTNNKGGENAFVASLDAVLNCPIVGGGAAIGDDPTVPGLPFPDAQAQLLCITDPTVSAQATFENIHSEILGECQLEFTNPRILDRINGEDAAEFLKAQKARLGLPETDFEHLTFSTAENINAHLNKNDGVHIASGRDLEPRMLLRYAPPECVQQRIEAFYNDPEALVFGCAGLRGIMDHTHEASSFGGFFFGEICTVNGHGEYGNLMLSKLRIEA